MQKYLTERRKIVIINSYMKLTKEYLQNNLSYMLYHNFNWIRRDCFGYNYLSMPLLSQAQLEGQAAMNDDSSNYLEEWKTAVGTSQDFDKMLVDLRKYGFSILTGLITAGSFLGFSSSLGPPAANIIHIGVINVTMFLVVILFWLDIYYQNLLYGSVLRTRFLEFFRLKHRLSVYISGVYTGSSMGVILYLIYGGFLVGVLFLGYLVAGISNQSDMIGKTGSAAKPNMTVGLGLGLGNASSLSAKPGSAANSVDNTSLLNLIALGNGSLIASFLLGVAGMIAIAYLGVGLRDKKLKKIMNIFKDHLWRELTEKEIMDLEKEIYGEFKFKV
jgi:hypothetical protein